MRTYNGYIVSLVAASGLLNTLLAFAGQKDVEVYFAINIIAYLAITMIYVYLNPRARKALNNIGFVLFGSFMVIVSLKIIDILSGK